MKDMVFIFNGVIAATTVETTEEAVPAETTEQEAPVEGEAAETSATGEAAVGETTETGGATAEGGYVMDDAAMAGMETEVGQQSKTLTQSVPAMAGVTAAVLALSILAGMLLAKLKIKKGINLYED